MSCRRRSSSSPFGGPTSPLNKPWSRWGPQRARRNRDINRGIIMVLASVSSAVASRTCREHGGLFRATRTTGRPATAWWGRLSAPSRLDRPRLANISFLTRHVVLAGTTCLHLHLHLRPSPWLRRVPLNWLSATFLCYRSSWRCLLISFLSSLPRYLLAV